MEQIFSRLKKIFLGLDRKKEQFGLSVEFFEQKKTATDASSDCLKDKTI